MIRLSSDLDAALYDIPLTLKTYLPEGWKGVRLSQNERDINLKIMSDSNGSYVSYSIPSSETEVQLVKLEGN